jgi:hypothetical protein
MATRSALTVRGRTGLVRRHARSLAALVVGIGASIAIANAFVVVIVAAVVTALALAERPHRVARRARRAMRAKRSRRLVNAQIANDELVELTAIADAVRDADPTTAEALDLEGLLDRFVDVAIARDRCSEIIQRDRTAAFARRARQDTGTRRDRTASRRIAWNHRCEARLHALDAQLEDIANLIRLYGERTTMPDVDLLFSDDPIAPVLARADACETT